MKLGAKLSVIAGLVLGLLALPGCALMTAGPAEPALTYDLVAPAKISPRGRRINTQLLINTPIAVRALDTDRILVRLSNGQVAYFPKAVWTDRLPRLLQVRLVESLTTARVVRAVGARSERMSSNLSLSTNIRAFQVNAENGRATAHINLYLKLVDDRSGHVLAARGFEAIVPARSDTAENGVEALNAAFEDIARKIARWITRVRLPAI